MRLFSSGSVVLMFLVAACGDDSSQDLNNVTVVTPTSPTGYVAGLVHNATDDSPLSGVRVVLFGGGTTGDATTDSNGQFSFGPIAAGALFSLRFSADGYADVTLSQLAIDDASGNFPTANGALFVGPIALIPIGGTYAVQVVDDLGSPVQNAAVTFEITPRYIATTGGGAADVRVMSDVDGIAKTMALPDVRALPLRHAGRLLISVAPVDRNGDGAFELRGASIELGDRALREGGGVPVLVLHEGDDEPLRVIASNLGTLIDRTAAAFPVIGTTDPIRVVFNKAVERDSVMIDLRDETGNSIIAAPHVVSASGTIITIDPSEDLTASREYNISVTAASVRDGVREMFSAATPFFARVDPAVMISITGRFNDTNRNGVWGDNDVLEMTATSPIGRSRVPGGNASLWLALDFNGTGVIGDAQGELPPSGQPFPPPFTITLTEPTPANGAGLSGYTRFFAPMSINLPTPIGAASGGAAFEVRIEEPLTDISGRPAPARTTGTALLQ